MKRKNVITKIIVVSLICLLVSTTARAELFSEEQETLEGVEFVAEEQPDEPETEAGNEKPEFLSRSYDLDPAWVEFIQGLNDMVMQDQDQDLFEGALVIDLEEKTVLNEKQEEVFEYSELIQQVLEQDDPESVQAIIHDTEYSIYLQDGAVIALTDASMTKRLLVETEELADNYGAIEELMYGNFYFLRYETPEETKNAYKQLLLDGTIEDVEYDRLIKPEYYGDDKQLSDPEAGSISLMSNSYDDWGSELMGIDELRDNLASHSDDYPDVLVAVLDTEGFDISSLNTIFSGRMRAGRHYDLDLNYQVVYDNNLFAQALNHGTRVSSVLLKSTPNNVEVLPVRISTYATIVAGIGYVVLEGAAVVNMSFTGFTNNLDAQDAFYTVISDTVSNTGDQVVFIAASGDYDDEIYYYPACTPYVISVAGIQRNGAGNYSRWIEGNGDGSTYNDLVDFCAPAKGVNKYDASGWNDTLMAGTSFAAPYMSAAAAMILMVEPTYTRDDVYETFLDCAQDLGPAGGDKYYGWGYVNLSDFTESYPVTSVSISPSKTTIATQGTRNLSAIITPHNAIIKDTEWSSANSGIASVNQNGKVTGISYGKTNITALTFFGLATATCEVRVRYSDVNDVSKYYFRPVYWMAYNGITGGTNNNSTFFPDNNCTRAQLAEFFWKLAGTPSPGISSSPFSDVNNNDNHHSAIYWAYNNNIIGGYADGTFRPNNPCTRIQTVLMLWKFANMPDVNISVLPFNDIGELSTNQKKAAVWAYNQGIAGGYHDGTFRPTENCLRKHIATFLYKYARSGITLWTCTGCGLLNTNEADAEAHCNSVENLLEHYGTYYDPVTQVLVPVHVTKTYPYRVSSNVELVGFYYGYLPWSAQ